MIFGSETNGDIHLLYMIKINEISLEPGDNYASDK